MSRLSNPLPLIAVACFLGCDPEPPPETGRLSMALVTTAPDGGTYRLTTGAEITARSGSFFETFPLEGEVASVLIDLPVGEYEFTLTHPYGFVDTWPLNRVNADGSETTVWGTLLTPQPAELEILEGATTSLVLSFRVAASEVITFAQGSLEVSAEVDVVAANGAFFGSDATLSIDQATIHPDAPGALAAYWPSAGTGGLSVLIGGTVGNFRPHSSTRVCAELELTRAPQANGHPGFAELVNEPFFVGVPGADPDLCIESAAGTQTLEIQMARVGQAQGTTLAGGQEEYLFFVRFAVELPFTVFDGQTLDLGLLDWTHGPYPLTGELSVAHVTQAGFEPWFDAVHTGSASFNFVPTAN